MCISALLLNFFVNSFWEITIPSLLILAMTLLCLLHPKFFNFAFGRIILLFVIFLYYPLLYLRTGEIFGIMPMFFVTISLFVVLIFNGKSKIFVLAMAIALFEALFYMSYVNSGPDGLMPITLLQLMLAMLGMPIAVIASSVILAQIVKLFDTAQAQTIAYAEQLNQKNAELVLLSSTDALTGICNRRVFIETLDRVLTEQLSESTPLCVCMLDLDHFKNVNDHYGHNVGDEVLKMVAEEVPRHLRQHDLFARYGGEEFTLLFTKCELDVAYEIAERIRAAVEELRYRRDISCTVSIGIAAYHPGDTTQTLISAADKSLYKAKDQGRNLVVR